MRTEADKLQAQGAALFRLIGFFCIVIGIFIMCPIGLALLIVGVLLLFIGQAALDKLEDKNHAK